MLACSLLSALPASAGPDGDFAPLAVGNTWVYSLREEGNGFWWNPTVGQRVHRTLRVESRAESPGGALYVLSFRDSAYQRTRTPDSGSQASRELPDTLITGRFQVAEFAADGRLTLLSLGRPIPPGMEVFFRRRVRSGETAAVTAAGDSLRVVSVGTDYNTNLVDSAVYARDLGLIHFRRYHRWWEGPHHAGRVNSICVLESFNGRPVGATGIAGALPPVSRVEGFSGLERGRRWRYRGLRQRVPGANSFEGNHLRIDSIVRDLAVTGVADSGGSSIFTLTVKDSLHHRAYDGHPQPDKVEKGTISVTRTPGNPLLALSMAWASPELKEDLLILFNRQSFPEAVLDVREYGGRPLRILEYRVGLAGLMEDTLIHAEGIGIIRRSKAVPGIFPGLSDRFEWNLVELDGLPFDARPVSIRPVPAPRAAPMSLPSPRGKGGWRMRNLLGRLQER